MAVSRWWWWWGRLVGTPLSHMMSLIGSRLCTQSSRILAKSELCLHSLMIGYVSEVYPVLVNGLSSAHTSRSRLQAWQWIVSMQLLQVSIMEPNLKAFKIR